MSDENEIISEEEILDILKTVKDSTLDEQAQALKDKITQIIEQKLKEAQNTETSTEE